MGKFTKSKLLLQIVVASFVATLATASIVGATTIGTDISTGGTLGVTGVTTLGNNITVPAAYGLDTTGAGALNIGTSTATSIRIGDTGVTTTNAGALTVTGATTLSSTLGVTGLTTLSNNITVPNGYGLDAVSGALNIGTTTAGSITIGKSGITTTNAGALIVTGATTLSSTLGVTGLATFSNNITVPAAYGLDTTGAGALNIGTSTATSIRIGDTGVITTFPGDVAITGTLSAGATTITGLVLNNKTLTLTDSITLNATSTTDGHIMIADATTGSWINKAVSGDITITKAGVTAIVANAVAGTDIALDSEAAGDIMYANGTDWVRLAKSTDGFILTLSNGVPSWVATTTLANISGTLAIANGGTGATTGGAALAALGAAASGANGDITSLTAIASIDKAGAITIGNTNATALTIGRNGITTTFPGTNTFTGGLNVNGNATTTTAGIISPARYPVFGTVTACGTTLEGGFVWQSTTKKVCVCDGTNWIEATSTSATVCTF